MSEPLPGARAARRVGRGIAGLAGLLLLASCGDESLPPPGAEGDPAVGLEQITAPAEGEVHLVSVVQRGGSAGFEPSEVIIRQGEVVRFVMGGSLPVSIVFDADAADFEAAGYLRDQGLHLGVLLTDPGQVHDASFEGAPAGRYPFVTQPAGAAGVVTVRD